MNFSNTLQQQRTKEWQYSCRGNLTRFPLKGYPTYKRGNKKIIKDIVIRIADLLQERLKEVRIVGDVTKGGRDPGFKSLM